jgi:colicin import membrane protein
LTIEQNLTAQYNKKLLQKAATENLPAKEKPVKTENRQSKTKVLKKVEPSPTKRPKVSATKAKKPSADSKKKVSSSNQVASKSKEEHTRKADKAAAEEKKKQEAEKREQAQQKAQKEGKEQQLLAKAQERIAKIAKSHDKGSSNKLGDAVTYSFPSTLALNIDAISDIDGVSLSRKEISYRDELASRLKLLLRLPEYGDVKVKLTLKRSGRVANVMIVHAESMANHKYIEKTLPSLVFPSFGSDFGDAKEYTFSITLSNEL